MVTVNNQAVSNNKLLIATAFAFFILTIASICLHWTGLFVETFPWDGFAAWTLAFLV